MGTIEAKNEVPPIWRWGDRELWLFLLQGFELPNETKRLSNLKLKWQYDK
jgi:hypothetical protein